MNSKNVDFPLLMGIPDSQIVSTNLGTKWTRYDALRDVFFIVDHTGKITARIDGNRGNFMGNDNLNKVKAGITAALAALPATAVLSAGNADLCLKACKRGGLYQFDLAPGRGSRATSPCASWTARAAWCAPWPGTWVPLRALRRADARPCGTAAIPGAGTWLGAPIS